MAKPITFTVCTAVQDRPVTGSDSCIAGLPEAVRGVGGVLNVSVLGRLLRTLSHEQAERMGETLHHAEWVITDDPKVARAIAIHDPACGRCVTEADQIAALLTEHPREVLAGILYWAQALILP